MSPKKKTNSKGPTKGLGKNEVLVANATKQEQPKEEKEHSSEVAKAETLPAQNPTELEDVPEAWDDPKIASDNTGKLQNHYKMKPVRKEPPEKQEEDALATAMANSQIQSQSISEVEEDGCNNPKIASSNTGKPQNSRKNKPLKNEASTGSNEKQLSASTNTDYDKFERIWKALKNKNEFIVVKETNGNLFEMDKEYSLANCVAADLNMGAGIAVTFRQDFKNVGELLQQKQHQGGLAVLSDNDRFIYYLVTKRVSTGKPTYETLFKSLVKMMEHMVKNNVQKLAIPRLGCGLDRLEWDKVKVMLEHIFQGTSIDITVCNFQQAEDVTSQRKSRLSSRVCPFNEVNYPITNAHLYSIILYLGDEHGNVDQNLTTINETYKCITDYKQAQKRMGTIVTTVYQAYNFYIVGCIVKKDNKDEVDFKAFEDCVRKINKENQVFAKTHENYKNVSIMRYSYEYDDLFMDKLINLLRYTLYDIKLTVHN